ncbi:hypothetical protein, partial [Parafrankia irregularis]|uniref:hypothetical protein n=1 Tax=Parafrankia irregularis TaxID=795642 RepID=UPI001A95B760
MLPTWGVRIGWHAESRPARLVEGDLWAGAIFLPVPWLAGLTFDGWCGADFVGVGKGIYFVPDDFGCSQEPSFHPSWPCFAGRAGVGGD